jgi:hypothetical protein
MVWNMKFHAVCFMYEFDIQLLKTLNIFDPA